MVCSSSDSTPLLDITPIVNPDGFYYSQTSDRLWRKNRQTVSGNSCVGRDINRNWPYKWELTGGASTNPCSETYKGQAAGDAPENRGLVAQVLALKASRGISLYLDVQYVRYSLCLDDSILTTTARMDSTSSGPTATTATPTPRMTHNTDRLQRVPSLPSASSPERHTPLVLAVRLSMQPLVAPLITPMSPAMLRTRTRMSFAIQEHMDSRCRRTRLSLLWLRRGRAFCRC